MTITMKKLLALILTFGVVLGSQAATTAPLKITVVDTATRAPIAGARVDYYVEVSDGGRKRTDLFRVKGTTSDKGEVSFAPKEIADVSYGLFGMSTNYGGPTVVVYADGYEPFSYSPRLMSKNLREASKWDGVNPMQVKLRPILPPRPDQK
jgi:hypothetical protein